jgi:hypothetical protein
LQTRQEVGEARLQNLWNQRDAGYQNPNMQIPQPPLLSRGRQILGNLNERHQAALHAQIPPDGPASGMPMGNSNMGNSLDNLSSHNLSQYADHNNNEASPEQMGPTLDQPIRN